MGLTGAVGRQITEVDGEGGKNGAVIDGGSDQLETDLEAEFVLDNFGLGGGDGQVVGNAIAAVVGEEAEHIGLGSLLQGACEGIVGEDIALQEVIQGEHGLGQDGDRRRREVEIDTAIGSGVGDTATDGVAGGLDRSGGVFGKDAVDGSTAGGGGETAGAIERSPEARESGGGDRKAIGDQIVVLVVDLQIDVDGGEINGGIEVFEHERALKGIPGEHHVLVDADLDPGGDVGQGNRRGSDHGHLADGWEATAAATTAAAATTTATATANRQRWQGAVGIDQEGQGGDFLHRDRRHLVGQEGAVIPEQVAELHPDAARRDIGDPLDAQIHHQRRLRGNRLAGQGIENGEREIGINRRLERKIPCSHQTMVGQRERHHQALTNQIETAQIDR